MDVVKRGLRSSILREEGTLYRVYHDTGEMQPLPFQVDECGGRRYAHNCTARSLCARKPLPPHLKRATRIALETTDIRTFARRCGVQTSTAWSYLTQICEASERVGRHVLSSSFLCPSLVEAMREREWSGTLRDAMRALERGPLLGHTGWRCEEDRYCQLRLARVCACRCVLPPCAENGGEEGREEWNTPSSPRGRRSRS